MKISNSKKLLYVALASGLAFGLLVVFMPHGSGTTNTWSDLAAVLLSQFISIVAVSFVAGWVLKDAVANSYIVASFAVLYLYATSRLVGFARLFDDIIYILLLTLASVALFYTSSAFFNRQSINKLKKAISATVLFIVLFIVFSLFGLFFTRTIAPLIIR